MYTGIRRRFDDLGRVVIPKEIRDSLNIESKDLVDIVCTDGKIVLTPIIDLKYNKIQKIEFFIKDLFENVDLYIIDNNKVLYSNIKDNISKNKFEICNLNKNKFKYNEDILLGNIVLGSIYLFSKIQITKKEKAICSLIANSLI